MGRKKILVIEDDPDLGLVVEVSLKAMRPWYIAIASSGREGIRLAQSDNFHAILLDWFMPDMNGLVVLNELQENAKTMSIPVILLTVATSFNRRNGVLPIAGIIQKPFDPITLADSVSNILCW